jgi:hypothetical protein
MICTKCHVEKEVETFQLRKDTNKRRGQCNDCRKQLFKEYIKRTNYKVGDKLLEKRKQTNATEIKVCSSCQEELPLASFELRADTKCYRNQCKACRNEYVSKVKKLDKHKQQQNKRARERRQTDPGFLINQRLRARLRKVLLSQNAERLASPYELLGCSVLEFKEHIQKQFVEGMSWELKNFELDHIIPCAFFDLTDVTQQKKCFHYSNFQPLKRDDNNLKRDFILEQHMQYLFSIMF